MTNKRKGVICTFPQCNKTLTTSKFKQHFARHLKEGESYDVSHRNRYERALDDASLLPEGQDEGANVYLVAQLRTILARLQAVDERLQGLEGRMASIEELLRARPPPPPPIEDRQERVNRTIEESSPDEEEDANEDEREEADKDADVEMETPASAGDVDGADDGPKSPATQRRVLRALRNLR
ncbi:hypothetical protein PHYSODRAFT_328097 [Phytophthora sojae]|uniref:Uncharacterized protein n=1 Tax=Phytophthora sojae (strain P6497) TaxID=1094619 RepID=G4Z1S8_PHYSP|nr:hypothetical protein PHYSODRAFT_263673 [Phytophthora sojae]XP_009522643.1 hypothetical protein PHYSODRAFT_328097 [Phytophthora sojae]EGZ19922.1 hypothetical protein PHYSODRAFT_263673 [Phytophthora sojae]EGZ19926.1 hypothetical protein PHYSODRAFT_328097 [Phytophthora sojae]|eukprot:XP_009522639.1 hypothetical protein PHYSODRAFT_263673 [Phytophthora sojae]